MFVASFSIVTKLNKILSAVYDNACIERLLKKSVIAF